MVESNEEHPTSLVERAYAALREAIVEGRYEAGAALPLNELATSLGVSLIPVREAVRKLQMERLVDIVPNKGVRVAALTLDDLRDSYRTRILLEAEALRLAHENLTDSDIKEARALIDAMVAAYDEQPTLSAELHRDLHFLIYDRAGSSWLGYLIRLMWAHTERYRRLGTPVPSGGDLGGEHLKMVEALAQGRIDDAVAALRLDLEHTAQRASRFFDE